MKSGFRLEVTFKIYLTQTGHAGSDELEVLSVLIDSYEKEHFPIEAPDPIEAVKLRMEQLEIKQKNLTEILGFKSKVSEVLNRKRKLTLEMIRNLYKTLNNPTNVLIQEY